MRWDKWTDNRPGLVALVLLDSPAADDTNTDEIFNIDDGYTFYPIECALMIDCLVYLFVSLSTTE